MLESLRDAVREQLASAGLGGGLDTRYRIRTAHMTVVRFQNPLNDNIRLLQFLEKNRLRDFGKTVVREVLFIENDWYMSEDKVRVLGRYEM